MADLAVPFPIAVISRLLGIPDADTTRFNTIGMLVGQSLDGVRTLRQAERLRRAGEELAELFTRLAADRRCEPRDDVLGLLSAAEVDGRLDPRDLVATCGLLLVAGFETTVNLIGNGMAALHRHPDQWRTLVDDSALGAAVVEETLRWDPPVQATGRIADVDTELDGREVPRARRWP